MRGDGLVSQEHSGRFDVVLSFEKAVFSAVVEELQRRADEGRERREQVQVGREPIGNAGHDASGPS